MKRMLLASTFEGFEPKLDDPLFDDIGNKNIVCIPTAAQGEKGHESWLPAEMAPLQKRAGNFIEFDIAGKSYEEVDLATQDADIIYVTGGNTYYLLEQVRACNLKPCIEKCFERGGIYYGSSAGAIITGPRIDFVGEMDHNETNLTDFTGLNLINSLFMPHLDHEKFAPIISGVLDDLKSGDEEIIALNDDQALYIEGSYTRII